MPVFLLYPHQGLAPEGLQAGSPGLRPWDRRPPLPYAPEGRNDPEDLHRGTLWTRLDGESE
jgi:hypothetical protein